MLCRRYSGIHDSKATGAVRVIEDCSADIRTWTENNLLKLNLNKTELIVFSSKQSVNKAGNFRLNVGPSYIESAKSVRTLGIILDKTLEMAKEVNVFVNPATTR